MGKNKFFNKMKEGVSVEEVESFARKYATEVFLAVAMVIGAFSSMFDFFTGPSLTILFTALGIVLGIFFPDPIERGFKQFYGFTFKQEGSTQMIVGAVTVAAGIFVPFLLFGTIGLLAGTAYHYFTRNAQVEKNVKKPPASRGDDGEEHD